MKQLFSVFLCALIFFFIPLNVSAEDTGGFENAGALYDYWMERNILPEYITGVWSSDGSDRNLTFGVTNDAAGREGAKRILEFVADDNTVTFAYQTYAQQDLYEIQADVERYLKDDIGFKSVGVYFPTNRVEVDVDQKRLDDPKTIDVVNALVEKYGNAVSFSFTNGEYRLTNDEYRATAELADSPASGLSDRNLKPTSDQPSSQKLWLYGMFGVSAVCLAALVVSEYKRRKLAALLSNGENVKKP